MAAAVMGVHQTAAFLRGFKVTLANTKSTSKLKKSIIVLFLIMLLMLRAIFSPRLHDKRHRMVVGCQPYAPAAFTPMKCS